MLLLHRSSRGKRCILHLRCITSTGAPPYKMQPRRNPVKEENATSIWSLSSSDVMMWWAAGRWKHKELTSVAMRRATWASLFTWRRTSATEIEDQFTHPHSTSRLFQERWNCKIVRVFWCGTRVSTDQTSIDPICGLQISGYPLIQTRV